MATKFITISIEIMHDTNLTANQKFILAEIEQLSTLDRGCIASNQHFSDLIGIAKESVSRSIKGLIEMEYIDSKITPGTRNHERLLTLNKMLRPPKQNVNTPLTKRQETKENKTINKTINKPFSFTLKRKASIENTSKEYQEKLKAYIQASNKQMSYDDFYNSCVSKDYRYKNFKLAFDSWNKESKASSGSSRMCIGGIAI